MKRSVVVVLLLSLVFALDAQTAKEEIFSDVHRSGGTYYAYPGPENAKLTPAPAGYHPFYISTYQRHGARFFLDKNDYANPFNTLKKADKLGKLTDLGKKVMHDLGSMLTLLEGRNGELAPLGVVQHAEVAKRMFTNFPEVFKGDAKIEARSTTVIRCILSMMNACLQLKAMNPNLTVKSDASIHDKYYMNSGYKEISALRKAPKVQAFMKKFDEAHTHPARLMGTLFTDRDYVKDSVNSGRFMRRLFTATSNIQSHSDQTTIDLYPIFTKQECYDLWTKNNLRWYIRYGPSPLTQSAMPFNQSRLLENILTTADTCVVNKGNGATMRFGHDTYILPLAALLELGDCGKVITDPDLVANEWRNYKIFMMASNIQLVFYRQLGNPDILVKALLNEHEVTLPVKTDVAPYYHWKDLSSYYRNKLAKFKSNFNWAQSDKSN
ncbi:MAG: histidine acid phosphatase [Bacteroidaceae bacterium]|nr:histidine acid phosphatase [Bacteroidaceae bacterium]